MKGLCHSCLSSDVELIEEKGRFLCMNCHHKLFPKKSAENEEVSLDKLKEKWEH